MKLFLISRTVLKNQWWDSYDCAVVAAETSDSAKLIHPDGIFLKWDGSDWIGGDDHSWTNPENVIVEYIGETHLPAGVICASFNRA